MCDHDHLGMGSGQSISLGALLQGTGHRWGRYTQTHGHKILSVWKGLPPPLNHLDHELPGGLIKSQHGSGCEAVFQ